MAQSSFVSLFRFNKFIRFSFILFFLLGSSLFTITAFAQNENTSKENKINLDTSYKIDYDPRLDQSGSLQSISENQYGATPNLLERSLSTMDLTTTNGAILRTETNSSTSNLDFSYKENFTDTTSNKQMNNDDTFTVNTLEAGTFTDLEANISTYTNYENRTVSNSLNQGLLGVHPPNTIAQGLNVSFFKGQSTVSISSFYITTQTVNSAGVTSITGEVWTAKLNGSRVEPDTMVRSTTITPSNNFVTANYTFKFSTPANISTSDTYVTGSGLGYFFFVVYGSGDTINIWRETSGSILNATTYSYAGGAPPLNTSEYSLLDYDFAMGYDASFDIDPTVIGTNVYVDTDPSTTAVLSDGTFSESMLRTGDTIYRVNYSTVLTSGFEITPSINVVYTSFVNFQNNSQISYTSTPNDPVISWKIQFDSTYTNSSTTISKYFTIPNNFTLTSIYLNNTELSPTPGEYSIGTDINGNKIIYFEVAHGNYSVFATSTNLLDPSAASIQSYIFNTGWDVGTNATMGILHPTGSAGDTVNATITNIGSLGLNGGWVNASLRTPTGLLLPRRSVTGYVDSSDFNTTFDFTNSMTFSTVLDPDIPTGYWSFQFRWFNGTAAGAVALEFIVLPSASLELLTPSSSHLDVIEGAIVNIVVSTLDQSHNDTWGNTGVLKWDFDADTDMIRTGRNGKDYTFSASINTDYTNNTVLPNFNYTLTMEFVDGPFTISISFTMRVFYRANTDIIDSAPIEVGDTLDIDFAPINLTQGGIDPFKNSSVTYVLSTNGVQLFASSSQYDPVSGYYNLTLDWSDEFSRGSTNEIIINWTLSAFRNIVTQTYISASFTFTVYDISDPDLGTAPNPLIYDEGDTGKEIFWQPNDPHPGVYNLTLDSTIKLAVNTIWNNTDGIQINVDGLEAGVHSYFIEIYDIDDNFVTNTVSVTVFDVTKPNFSVSPPNLSMDEGSSNNLLVWSVDDLHLENYTLLEDDLNVESASSLGSTFLGVNWNIDHLTLGQHNLTVIVFDESDNFEFHTVIVTVNDVTDPTISDESLTLPYEEFSSGHSISWTVSDTNPSNYTIYQNNNPIQSGNWNVGSININVNSLLLGTYNFTLAISDSSGNTVFDEVLFDVIDTTPPVVTGPATYEYDEGQTGNQISWIVSDAHIAKYEITSDTSVNVPETAWITNDSIVLNIDGLSIGQYNITITVTDTEGNFLTHTVSLTVKDPQIQETRLIDSEFEVEGIVYEGDIERLFIVGWETDTDVGGEIVAATVNATLIVIDVSGFTAGEIVKQFSVGTANGEFALLLNYTGLLNGTYEWIFTFEKDLHQTQISPLGTYVVEILPHLLKIEITFSQTLTQGEDFVIQAKVSYDDPRSNNSTLGLSTLTSRVGGVPDIDVAFILTYLSTAGQEATLTDTITTDENGDAIWIIAGTATEFIESIRSISGTISNQVGFIGTDSEVTDFDLKVKEGSVFFNLIEDISNFVQDNSLIIALILVSIFAVFIYFIRTLRKRKDKFTVFAKESEDATVEIDGLRSIHGIILTAGRTGIPFYEYTFTSARTVIDSALISGISTALSMFLNELDEEKLGFEHMERAGVSITSHKSDLSTMMVISDSPLPPIILEQLELGHQAVESKFSKQLMIPDRMMDIEPVNITNELVSKSLKLNLKEDIIIRTNNLKKLRKRKSISRKIRNDMDALNKLAKLSDETQEPLNLEMILAFLESNNIDHATACRIIYLSYVNFIIVPI